ncbi:MAG TPA: hypothetical protein VEJ63_21875 [Planctomycetota bacterium]|nr:hypothetical protein [Planctomycetota bacterium]
MAAEKKPDPNATPPKKNAMIGGIICLAIGLSWFTWSAFLRPETEAEKKERIQREQEEANKKKHGNKPGGHGH